MSSRVENPTESIKIMLLYRNGVLEMGTGPLVQFILHRKTMKAFVATNLVDNGVPVYMEYDAPPLK